MNKPKGKVQRIELTEDEEETIACLLDGKPSPKLIQRWKKAGFNIEHKTKWYIALPHRERLYRIRQRHKIGTCIICRNFPVYKVDYSYDGITLVEWYCEKHKGYIK